MGLGERKDLPLVASAAQGREKRAVRREQRGDPARAERGGTTVALQGQGHVQTHFGGAGPCPGGCQVPRWGSACGSGGWQEGDRTEGIGTHPQVPGALFPPGTGGRADPTWRADPHHEGQTLTMQDRPPWRQLRGPDHSSGTVAVTLPRPRPRWHTGLCLGLILGAGTAVPAGLAVPIP